MAQRAQADAERPAEWAPWRPDEARHPTEIVLLDRAGVIVWVNEAWLAFARDNDADAATTGVGACYLAACAAAGDEPGATAVAGAIRAALQGDLPAPIAVCIPCDSTTEQRWFDVLVSERRDDSGDPVGAVLALMRRDADGLVEQRRSQAAQRAQVLLRERERIVDAVHESVLQNLFAVTLMLSAVAPGSVHLHEAEDLVRRTMVELRTIVALPETPSANFCPRGSDRSGEELAEILRTYRSL